MIVAGAAGVGDAVAGSRLGGGVACRALLGPAETVAGCG